MSHFFAYLSRMKFIQRWGLKRNTNIENIQEHSLQVAMVAHSLAVIKNRMFDGDVSPERVALLAIYHDASEVLTGDLPTPIKYFNPEIKDAYKQIESVASHKLFGMIPEPLKADYAPLLLEENADGDHLKLVKAADKICAYLKCVVEVAAGNQEFLKAEVELKEKVDELDSPEVEYFMKTFVPSFHLTLDELG